MACDLILSVSEKLKNELKVVHINAQSLNSPSHFDEFSDMFGNGEIEIIGVSETFFKDHSVTKICKYNAMTVNRKNRNGGGVAIYVREDLKSKILATSDGERGKPEYIICEITFGTDRILFACVYRPPHVGYIDIFHDDLCTFITQYKYTIICGDLNARFGSEEYETKLISNMLSQCYLTPVPFNSTFHTAYTSSTLDVIASNCSDIILEYGQIEAPGFSEHDLIYAVFNLKVPRFQRKTITYRAFKRLDPSKVYEYGNTLPWENIYKLNDINDKVQSFNDLLFNLLDTCAPEITVNLKKYNAPWMTTEIKSLFKERDRLRKVFSKTKNPNVYEKFRLARNKAKQQCRNAKVKYFNNLFE